MKKPLTADDIAYQMFEDSYKNVLDKKKRKDLEILFDSIMADKKSTMWLMNVILFISLVRSDAGVPSGAFFDVVKAISITHAEYTKVRKIS